MRLCSVVMKAVQSARPGGALQPATESGARQRQRRTAVPHCCGQAVRAGRAAVQRSLRPAASPLLRVGAAGRRGDAAPSSRRGAACARGPRLPSPLCCTAPPSLPLPCAAGKLGDDVSASKAQFDRRLPPEAVVRTAPLLLQWLPVRCLPAATLPVVHRGESRRFDAAATGSPPPPLPTAPQERTRCRLLALSAERRVDPEAASAALAAAYHAVTRDRVLH